MKAASIALGIAMSVAAQLASAQSQSPQTLNVEGNVFRPASTPPTDALVAQLRTPPGFTITRFADNVGNPRMMVVAPNGDVYVSDRKRGRVTLLRDASGSGKADAAIEVARAPDLHGLALRDNRLYMAAIREVYVADIRDDGTLGPLTTLYSGLPDAGQHPNRTLRFSPGGQLYLSVGSTCNACDEPNPESAALLQLSPDGATRRVYAKGLRNTIGFDWHPTTHALFGFDHGADWLGDQQPHEELNEIIEGADYGWPYVYDTKQINRSIEPPQGMSFEQYAARTTDPLLLYTAHAAPLGFQFYTGNRFPAEYRNDAFVTMRGSWNRAQPVGYNVVRVRFDAQGRPVGVEDFVGTWLTNGNQAHFGRLAGIVQHTDGSLLVADDTNGVIYRIAYTGQ